MAQDAKAPAESASSILQDILSRLNTLSRVTDALAEIHPYMRAATAILSGVIKPILNQQVRDTAFEDLLKEMRRTYDLVLDEFNFRESAKRNSVAYSMKPLSEIFRTSEECAEWIAAQYVTKNFWSRVVKNVVNGAEIDACILEFKTQFAILRESWRDAKLKYLEANALLTHLDFARGAGLTGDRICLAGTRTDTLLALTEWVNCPDSSRVLILTGVAGSGKSTIANTLAVQLRDRNRLAAFFAFERGASDRDARRLISTLAYELALGDEGYRNALVGQLRHSPRLTMSRDLDELWGHLIVQPGEALSASDPVLLVVDAFDECPGGSEDRSRQQLLELLSGQMSRLPANLRVLITSRAEPDIIATTQPSQRFDIGGMPAEEDIRLYVRSRLPRSNAGGLSDDECDELARAADGLFQWAATTCRFLEQRLAGTSMRKRYRTCRDRLLYGSLRPEGGLPSLDNLYLTVLEATVDRGDQAVIRSFRIALSLVLCAAEPISLSALCEMLSLVDDTHVENVAGILGAMGVVLEGTSDSSAPIRPMHTSFRDFLLDESRSGWWRLCPADLEDAHRTLSIGTLRLMARNLDDGGLPSSVAHNEDRRALIFDLPPGLLYSAVNWGHHTSRALRAQNGPALDWVQDVLSTTRLLLFDRFLFWIELLSVAGRPTAALSNLDVVWREFSSDAEIREFARDARRFIRFFNETIWGSASQVYRSALPFTPAPSVIRAKFLPRFPQAPRVTPVLPSWPIWTYWLEDNPVDQHALVICISDHRIATVGPGNGLKLFDVPSGTCLGKGKGTDSRVTSLAFSQARSLIATGHATGILYLWDPSTLREAGILDIPGRAAKVQSVVFAPGDGSYILSAHADGLTRQWHPETGKCLRTLETCCAPAGLACSRDLHRLFFASRNGTICVTDISQTDAAFSTVISGLPAIGALSYSPTRHHLAVGLREVSAKSCIEIWDAETFAFVGSLSGHQQAVQCLAWSPDGRYIASASRDGTVRLWDAVDLKAVGRPAHVGGLGGRGVIFSPDGTIVHSCANLAGIHSFSLADFIHLTNGPTLPSAVAYSTDGRYIKADFGGASPTTLYWDVEKGLPVNPVEGFQWRARSASSQDGRLTLLPNGQNIILRKTTDGKSVDTPLCESNAFLGSYDISPDGRRAVVLSGDQLRFWDLESCVEIGSPAFCGKWTANPTLSPDGCEVAVASAGGVRTFLVEPSSDIRPHTPVAEPSWTMTFDSNQSYAGVLARIGDQSIRIPRDYEPCVWYPGMRLLLGISPLSIAFPVDYDSAAKSRIFRSHSRSVIHEITPPISYGRAPLN